MIQEYVGQPIVSGLYAYVPHDIYHADPCPEPSLSASIAKRLVMESPLHAWSYHPRLGGMHGADTPATAGGSLIDSLILGGGPEIVAIKANDFKTNVAKQERDAAYANGKMPVIEAHLVEARAHAEEIKKRLFETRGFEFDGFSQVTAFWKEGDAWCRGRFDHWKPATSTIYDLKWVKSSAPDDIEKHMITYGVDIQRSAYVSATETIYPQLEGRVKFQPIFIESGPVLAINMRPVGATMRELGDRGWRRAVEIWTNCRANESWPDYGDNGTIEAPKWALEKDLNRIVEGMPTTKVFPF